MEKKFNWLAWLINVLYVLLFLSMCYLGTYYQEIGHIQGRNISFSVATLMFISGFAMLPFLYHWTLGKLLPIQKSNAIVVMKETSISHVYDSEGATRTFVKKFITFDLANGDRIAFRVRLNIFNKILIGESGLLTYKQQGKHTYFISFERNKRF